MRPLSLTLDGFRSYAERSEFDFRNRHLVGIVGPIGSGKSTILDAVAFALYGMTPTERSSTKSLIHQRSDAARVEFVFEVDGQVWRSVRALRRAGQSEHALFRYSSDEGFLAGEDPLETVLKKGEVDQRIEDLLGLDFPAFNRSVLLAQGRFSELLRATATQRDEVLKGVFGFDRVGAMERLAKLRRDTAGRDLEEMGRQRDLLEESRRRQEVAEVEAGRTKKRLDELIGIEPAIATQAALAGEAEAQREEAQRRLEGLTALADQMPDPADSHAILVAAASSLEEESALAKDAVTARAQAQAAAERVTEILTQLGGEAALVQAAAIVASLRSHRQALAGVQARLTTAKTESAGQITEGERLEAVRAAAAVEDEQASARLAAAEADARAAELAHPEALHADMATTLRSRLEEGAACPVCAQNVAVLPKAVPVDVAAAERSLEEARQKLSEAVSASRSSSQRLIAAEKEVEAAEKMVATGSAGIAALEAEAETVRVAIAGAEEGARRLLGEGEPEERLGSHQAALAEARAAAAESQQRADEVQGRLEAGRRAAQEAGSALEGLSAKLHGLAGRLDEEIVVGTRPGEVENALAEVRKRWTQAQQAAADARAEADTRLEATRGELARLHESVGLDAGADFTEAKAQLQATLAGLNAEAEIHRERVADSATLGSRMDEAQARFDLYKTLATELTPSRFLNFLLREERAVLSDLGGHRFEELSGGRFRFSTDGDFDIIDLTAAEQVRKADSLSGGETFLASLALALALAEMVTRGGGRLDAFFLDEGFGSLDPEHLDLAMAGIEKLVTGHEDRLVVIVSHVPEMRERIEDLIVLDKDPGTGATVVV